MGMMEKWKSLRILNGKYKYVLIVVIIGVLLMLIPDSSQKEDVAVYNTIATSKSESITVQLEELLGFVNGVGEVHVLLTMQSGEEVIYKTDEKGSMDSINTSTVIISDSQRNQTGLIQQTISPQYRGAIVVCEGADKADVRLAITDAVTNATGLRSDQISVLKMK